MLSYTSNDHACLPKNLFRSLSSGMHKKSLEASKKMSEEGEDDSSDGKTTRGRDEFKSESIASLRAKAQEHSARVLQALNKDSGCESSCEGRLHQTQAFPGGRDSASDSGRGSSIEGSRPELDRGCR